MACAANGLRTLESCYKVAHPPGSSKLCADASSGSHTQHLPGDQFRQRSDKPPLEPRPRIELWAPFRSVVPMYHTTPRELVPPRGRGPVRWACSWRCPSRWSYPYQHSRRQAPPIPQRNWWENWRYLFDAPAQAPQLVSRPLSRAGPHSTPWRNAAEGSSGHRALGGAPQEHFPDHLSLSRTAPKAPKDKQEQMGPSAWTGRR